MGRFCSCTVLATTEKKSYSGGCGITLFLSFAGGIQRGEAVSLWHTTLLVRCSVLYLMARLARKCVLTLGGNTLLSDRKADRFL